MSFIPNTTPTPNWLYNGEMKKMSDVELRVVLVITRATLGWEENHETGMRKVEDWISKSQIIEKTGRSSRSITYAIANCIKNGWIEARNKSGELLETPEKRSGNKIYYRLGSIFIDKLKTSAKSAQVDEPVQIATQTRAKSAPQPVQNLHTTKETLTKENIQKNTEHSSGTSGVVIDLFKIVNPSYKVLFKRKPQHEASKRLLEREGIEKLTKVVEFLQMRRADKFCPQIATPIQLEDKWSALEKYAMGLKSDINKYKVAF